MAVSPRPAVGSTIYLDQAGDLGLHAAVLLEASSLLLGSITTLAEANRALSQQFIIRSSNLLQNSLDVDKSSQRAELPEFVELITLGRAVVRSLTESSVRLAQLSGGRKVGYLPRNEGLTTSLMRLDAGFRQVFGQLSIIEIYLSPEHFDGIRNAITLVRDQHVLNSTVAREVLDAIDNMLGRSLLLLRSVESIVNGNR